MRERPGCEREKVSWAEKEGKVVDAAPHVGVEVTRAAGPGDGEPNDDGEEGKDVRGSGGDVGGEGGCGAQMPSSEAGEEDEGKNDWHPRPSLDDVQDSIAAEGHEHRNDGDDDNTGVDREVAGVDRRKNLSGDDTVDSAEAMKWQASSLCRGEGEESTYPMNEITLRRAGRMAG